MWPHRRQPTRLHHPWDSPGKNTGVGCHFLLQCMKVKVKVKLLSHVWLSDPMDCSLPGSSVHEIFQARVLEWVPLPSPLNNINRVESEVKVLATWSCPTLYNPMDCSPPGSSVHGILQARILDWVAISFFRGIFPIQGSNLGLLNCRRMLYPLSHLLAHIKQG